jgi:hypothetical protein
MGGNCCAAPEMSGSAAIHGTLGVIGRGGESRLRLWCARGLWRGRIMVMMMMRRTITVVHCHCMA